MQQPELFKGEIIIIVEDKSSQNLLILFIFRMQFLRLKNLKHQVLINKCFINYLLILFFYNWVITFW